MGETKVDRALERLFGRGDLDGMQGGPVPEERGA